MSRRVLARSERAPGEREDRGPGPSTLRRVLFMGSLVDPNDVGSLPQVSEAANRFQMGLIQGMLDSGITGVSAVTALPVGAFPRRGPPAAGGMVWLPRGRLRIVAPRFLNVVPLKPLAVHDRLRRAALRESTSEKPQVVVSYNPVPGHGSAGLAVARQLGVPFITIAADFTPTTSGGSLYRSLLSRWGLRILRASDGVIVLSGHSGRELTAGRPWTKIDGGLVDDWRGVSSRPGSVRSVVYSGTWSPSSGIALLLDAFRLVPDPDVQLVLSGRGPSADVIRRAQKTDPRIRVVDFLDRGGVQELMASATILVNPRPSTFPENRYNFPAKLLDYLASGRPVITTLAGDLDPVYRSLTYPLLRETPSALADLIIDVLRRPETQLAAAGAGARQWVLRERGWSQQARLAIDFLEAMVERQSA